jgi:hypothetical protein
MSPCKGEADQTIRGAEGYRFKRVNEAEGDVAAFSAVLQQYVKAPEINRTRLYLEAMNEILPQTGQKIIVDESMRRLVARSLREIVAKPGECWSRSVNEPDYSRVLLCNQKSVCHSVVAASGWPVCCSVLGTSYRLSNPAVASERIRGEVGAWVTILRPALRFTSER